MLFFLLALAPPETRLTIAVLYAKHKKELLKTAHEHLTDKSYTEDCVQDTFVRLIKYWDKFEKVSENNRGYYLAAICRNCAHEINARLHGEISSNVLDSLPEEALSGLFCGRENDSDKVEALTAAIEALGERYSAPLIMRVYGGMKYKEIAERLNISENAARIRVSRAKKTLAELMKGVRVNDG